ncbi:MAG: SurA N-terminal domain-containing protein [Bacteroidetes bacterium]|uniref:Periplasmic chaperone PpiD n=1 Tax=Candidatus Cryptobacteroides excrementipullorum TaxID=2840761 RepID=A0A9D9IRX7_9BACT|nr:SurA N-terminal domain-containing protein [Candidatus Cryptobacteroides excrementipullorum]
MAVLEKIRVKLGIFITVVIALALLSFIIDPSTLQSVSATMSSKYDVGEINGKTVSYNEFQKDVEYYTSINEMMTGTTASTEQQQVAIRNQAWQELINKFLFLKNAKAAGISVSESEMLALTTGDMVSPMIAQNPAFMDESGNFSKERLVQFVQQAGSDQSGSLKSYWNYLQNTIYTQQYYAKYGSLFTQSDFTNPLMLANEVEDNNNTTDVEFVMVPYGFATDSTIVVSDSEIKAYYDSHKKFYKQPASRDIEYVVIEVKPSDEDIAATNKMVTDVYDEFATTDNMKNFLLKNSDRQLSTYYYKRGELNTISPDINDFVFNDGKGASKVFTKNNTFYVARVLDTKMIPDSVYVRHILLQGDQESLADSLVDVLKRGKESFSNLAALYSADQNTATPERGDIGWMTQTYMIPGFESVMTAKLNTIFTLDTQYGKHIVEVTDRTEPIEKKQVAILERETLASKETFNDYYAKANAVAAKSEGKYENFKKAVEEEGLYAHPMNRMLESSDRLGAIDDTKEVTRWVFEQKKPGKVSNIITVNNNYFFVVALTGIHKEGYASVSEVSSSIKSILYAEKRGEKVASEVAEKIKGLGSMEAIASALETSVSTKEGITFASMTSQGLDPKFIGAVSVAEPGKISAPLAGNIGVYVYKVTAHDTGAFFTEDDAKARDAQMSQYSLQMLLPVMIQDADVTDNRARFY